MKQSKVFYVKTSKKLSKNKLEEMFKKVYDKFVNIDSVIFVNYDGREGLFNYSCWEYKNSFFILDNYSFLWKLPSGFSPNDVAGNVHHLDNDSNPIVLDLNIVNELYPLGFKFSKFVNIENEANKFCQDILNYKDITKYNFFDMKTKKEITEFLEKYDIDVSKFNEKILDKIDEIYLNPNFDKDSKIDLKSVNEMFWASKEDRESLKSLLLI